MTRFRLIATIGVVRVATLADPDVEPGHQWLGFSVDGGGIQLAALLDPGFDRRPEAGQLRAEYPGWLWIPHSQVVDDRLIELFDAVTAIRVSAPQWMPALVGAGERP